MARKNNLEDIEKELLGYLPKTFVLMYYGLVEQGLAQYTSPLGHAGESGGKPKRRFNTHDGGLRDEAALEDKRRIDWELRQMVRDRQQKDRPKCARCKKTCHKNWRYCSWCGRALVEVPEAPAAAVVPVRLR